MSGDDGLREAILNALLWCPSTGKPGCTHTHQLGEFADAVLALPELAALRAKADAADRHAADEIERLADERSWVTEHDNEVVSARDLYEHVARLRGELEPVTFDFPPDDPC